jgi:hypothetical protein
MYLDIVYIYVIAKAMYLKKQKHLIILDRSSTTILVRVPS